MKILVLGINHNTADIALREKLAVNAAQLPDILHAIKALDSEAVLLSTCNRTELYLASDRGFEHWLQFLADMQQISVNDLNHACYYHEEQEAVTHLLRVASGLDSMILGEPQILGQLKTAYASAQEHGTVAQQLRFLFDTAFNVSKKVRHDSNIGANAVTLAYALVQIAKRIFTDMTQQRITLVGTGETISLVATHLHGIGCRNITIVGRTLAKAQLVAAEFCDARAAVINELPTLLNQSDIVVSATASSLPLIGKGAVESSLKQRKRKPMLLIDLAMPRDIEAEIAELNDAYLYNIDDLRSIVEQGKQSRLRAAKQAEEMILAASQIFIQEQRVLQVNDLIQAYRQQGEQDKQALLAASLKALEQGQAPEVVLQQLAHQLTNKLLHLPTSQIREAAFQGQQNYLQWLRHWLKANT